MIISPFSGSTLNNLITEVNKHATNEQTNKTLTRINQTKQPNNTFSSEETLTKCRYDEQRPNLITYIKEESLPPLFILKIMTSALWVFVAPLLKVSPRQKFVFEQLLIYPPVAHYLQQVTEIFVTLIHKWRQTRLSTRGSGSLSACLVALAGTRMHTKHIDGIQQNQQC